MSFRFDEAEFRDLAARRLHLAPEPEPLHSDDDLNPDAPAIPGSVAMRSAAVLVPLVLRQPGLSLLLTQRTDHLTSHAGQVAFPGGKVDANDVDEIAAALRETEEETGIGREFVEPLGFLDTYRTVTSFRVVPVVALVRPGFTLAPHASEVADVFEVPLAFLMDPVNHQRHSRQWQGSERFYYAMPFGERYIWGATAGMIRNLYHRIYGAP